MKKLVIAAISLLVTAGLGSGANAQGKKSESTLTVNEPVEVPGTILAPGTYVIRVVDAQSSRNIVQITDVDGTKVFATAICTPHAQAASRPNTNFVYYENVSTSKVLRTWFASNDQFGQDFVYPRERAIELARAVKEPVPAYVATGPVTTEQLKTVEVVPVAEEKPVVIAEAPAPARVPVPANAPPVIVAENNLPATASVFPLAAGLGLLALAGAAGLHLIGRRIG